MNASSSNASLGWAIAVFGTALNLDDDGPARGATGGGGPSSKITSPSSSAAAGSPATSTTIDRLSAGAGGSFLDAAASGDELSGRDLAGARAGLDDDEDGGPAGLDLDDAGPDGDDDAGPACLEKKPSSVDCFLPVDEVGPGAITKKEGLVR